jgi:TolB protein
MTLRLILLFFTLGLTGAHALKIEITQGAVRPDPIAVTAFHSPQGDAVDEGQQIAAVIAADLESSGLFENLSSASFIQTPASLHNDGPRLQDWRLIKTRFLVAGAVEFSGRSLQVQFKLFDIITGQMLVALSFNADGDKWRKMAHMAADAIYSRITNETGYFNTNVVYVESASPKGRNYKTRLIKMDYDGANAKPITDGHEHMINPTYSPDGKWLIFGAFSKDGIKSFIMNLESKEKRSLGNFHAMNFAARFSPDSKYVVLSLVKNGTSAIYEMELATRRLTQLTPHSDIDTSPCYAPDGTQIVFTSNRHGRENLYIMSRSGSDVRRISFDMGKYSQPAWSPRGDYIAFTKQNGSTFYVGVMAPDGSGERLIAEAYLIERPVWSPNGRIIMFTKESGVSSKSALYQVDITGRNLRQLVTQRDGFDSTWSPLYK